MSDPHHALHAGDLVQVRSEEEILASLDASARLEGLPFMPEMLRHCGETLRVYKRADKTCDNNWVPGMRKMRDTVFLWGSRCDGAAHGGCQAGCLFFWKEDWLRLTTLTSGPQEHMAASAAAHTEPVAQRCSKEDLLRATGVDAGIDDPGVDDQRFSCQATEVAKASTALPPWDLSQYVRDVTSGNVGVSETVTNLLREVVAFGRHLVPRRPTRRRLDRTSDALVSDLNLQPGDRVQVRSRREIEATLDAANRNRGLSFNEEMLRYCGGEFPVLRRVERIINEPTGKMVTLKDCVILDGVVCLGDYHLSCPRSVYPYWREAWLRKLD